MYNDVYMGQVGVGEVPRGTAEWSLVPHGPAGVQIKAFHQTDTLAEP